MQDHKKTQERQTSRLDARKQISSNSMRSGGARP